MERLFPPLIYVIDDDADDFELLRDTINEKWPGVKLVYICDPTDFVSVLDQLTIPGMVILDVNMPQLTGFEVMDKLSRHATWGSVPVVFFSTSTNPADQSRGLSVGAAAFLTKPASNDEWSSVVDSLQKLGREYYKKHQSKMVGI